MRNYLKIIPLFFMLFVVAGCFNRQVLAPTIAPHAEQPRAEREFRAAWVATVDNIDWPSAPGLPVEQQKAEALAILDTVAALNMNAVIFQVRPQCDAFYQSELEPWSYYLTGVQGQAPQPYYDPLQFWIDEAHKRGLELHAWFNPYRAHHPAGGPVTEASIVKRKPDLVRKLAGGYYWLDPAHPGTRAHSLAVVMDVVKRYDVDGIHFDDYFYPYPSYNANKDFPDSVTWRAYLQQGGKLSRGDWRRAAVNTFIHDLYTAIKAEKRWVKFGLSPFGIYRPGQPRSIAGFDQYEVLYADARLWLQQGWVDYFTPQLYWPVNRIAQSYPVLLGWWNRVNVKQRHLWPGLYTSKVRDSLGVDENLNQIMIERGIVADAPGHVHFSVKTFLDTTALLNRALLSGPYARAALVPPTPWLDSTAPAVPQVSLQKTAETLLVKWDVPLPGDVFHWVCYYNADGRWRYQIMSREVSQITLPVFIEEIRQKQVTIKKIDQIAVTAVDRLGNESPLQVIFSR